MRLSTLVAVGFVVAAVQAGVIDIDPHATVCDDSWKTYFAQPLSVEQCATKISAVTKALEDLGGCEAHLASNNKFAVKVAQKITGSLKPCSGTPPPGTYCFVSC